MAFGEDQETHTAEFQTLSDMMSAPATVTTWVQGGDGRQQMCKVTNFSFVFLVPFFGSLGDREELEHDPDAYGLIPVLT